MYLNEPDLENIVQHPSLPHAGDGNLLIVMLAEKSAALAERLVNELRDSGHTFIGGIFPLIIHGDRSFERGAVILALPSCDAPRTIHKLSAGSHSVTPPRHMPAEHDSNCTAIVFTDCLARGSERLLDALFDACGGRYQFFGGGAGFSNLQPAPCVFSSEGLLQDAAVVAFVRQQSHLSSRHGWRVVRSWSPAARSCACTN